MGVLQLLVQLQVLLLPSLYFLLVAVEGVVVGILLVQVCMGELVEEGQLLGVQPFPEPLILTTIPHHQPPVRLVVEAPQPALL